VEDEDVDVVVLDEVCAGGSGGSGGGNGVRVLVLVEVEEVEEARRWRDEEVATSSSLCVRVE
jgi:hypothetical protein